MQINIIARAMLIDWPYGYELFVVLTFNLRV